MGGGRVGDTCAMAGMWQSGEFYGVTLIFTWAWDALRCGFCGAHLYPLTYLASQYGVVLFLFFVFVIINNQE